MSPSLRVVEVLAWVVSRRVFVPLTRASAKREPEAKMKAEIEVKVTNTPLRHDISRYQARRPSTRRQDLQLRQSASELGV